MLQWLYDRLEAVWAWGRQFSEHPLGKRILKGLRWLVVVCVVAYLAYQFTNIGWGRVWESLPTTPWFYILLLGMYTTLPLTEVVLYGKAWDAHGWTLLPALLRKRVLNNDVLGYSGEAYFYVWANRNTTLGHLEILETIKDNTILSSAASTSVAFLLLAVFFFSGQVDLLTEYLPDQTSTLAASVAIVIVVVVLGVTFRRTIFSLPSTLLVWIGVGHLTRFVLNNGFQITQWAVVIPEVSAGSWITLLSLYIIVNQVPFVPTRSLVFVSAGVELSGALQIPKAALASMLLAQSLIDRGLNILIYVGTTALDAATVDDEKLEELSLPEEMAEEKQSST